MSALYLRRGNSFQVSSDQQFDSHKTLPTACYMIKQDQFGNYFFEIIPSFELPGKIYGDTGNQSTRIVNTFLDRPASTGVLLAGEKGSGKTLLAKQLSVECASRGIPTIIINAPWCGEGFNQLIQNIQQPCMILIDEFEKVYDDEQQKTMLTLLDGTFPSKKLFVLTVNDKFGVNNHMKNRPGRIFYFLEYSGITEDFVREYAMDNLIDKTHVDGLARLANLFGVFNFDMLKAVVEEMNRYGESPKDAIKMLNARPQNCEYDNQYDVIVYENDSLVPKELIYPNVVSITPLADNISLHIREFVKSPKATATALKKKKSIKTSLNEVGLVEEKSEMRIRKAMVLRDDSVIKIDPSVGAFGYRQGDFTVILRKKTYDHSRWMDAF